MRVRQAVQVPRGDVVTWRDDAACLGVGPDIFFPEGEQRGGLAKQVCAGCPIWVKQACLDEALATPYRNDYGIRAGLTRHERYRMRRAAA